MFDLLRQPYPRQENPRVHFTRALLIGLFVGLFLLVFQPFGLQEWETPYKSLKLLGFGFVSFVVTALIHWLLPTLFPAYFREDTWTVGREIMLIMINILLIAIANYLYIGLYISQSNLLTTIGITFLIGIFPTTGSVVANYILQLRKYSRQAAVLPVHAPNQTGTSSDSLTFIAENEKDTLTVLLSDLFFIESSDNYSTFYYTKDGKLVKTLLRSSLSRLENQLQDSAPTVRHAMGRHAMVRCHRSYIVNLDKVEKVTGNAQGYKLHLNDGQFVVPVARKYNDSLVTELKARQ